MFLPDLEQPISTAHKNGSAPQQPAALPPVGHTDPQIKQRAARRSFAAADKLRILAEADACTRPGELGALLRREGLYASTLASFRKQRDEGKLARDPHQRRVQHLEKEAARQRDARKIASLEAENRKLKVLVELQKSSRAHEPLRGEPDARIALIQEAAPVTGFKPACQAIGWSRGRFYRTQKSRKPAAGEQRHSGLGSGL